MNVLNKKLSCSPLRILAFILCLTMTIGCLPTLAFAADDSILLETVYPQDEPNMFSFATQSSAVDEGNRYTITIVRSGDAVDEASVQLETVDVSAKYGEDYLVFSDESDTEVLETGGTLLQQATDYEEQAKRREELQTEIDSITSEVEPEEVNPETEDNITAAEADTADEQTEDTSISESDTKSDLAKLKEEQTGLPTRETSESEFVPLEEMFLQNAVDDFGSSLETSSSTEIVFNPGETEKNITVEIIDDKDSEGEEIFDLVLSSPCDGYSIGTYVNCSLTINDDEPVVHSVLSFSQENYDAEKQSVTITVNRSEALYSLCTTKVRTVDTGSAKEGINYSKVDAELTFEPYSEEYTFEIPVRTSVDEQYFDLELYDLKGAESGDTTRCSVRIPKTSDAAVAAASGSGDEEIVETASDDEQSFEITLDKTYTVRYNPGDDMGRIYDTDYKPEILVGDYYFTRNSSYNHYSGYSSPSWRHSKFDSSDGENGAAYCDWYDWRTWKNGSSYFYLHGQSASAFNTRTYQYISVDWKQTRSAYGGQRVGFELHNPSGGSINVKNKKIEATGEFSRRMSDRMLFLNSSNLPTQDNLDVRIYAIDQESNKTPKIELHCYGVAAMYRKFNITLVQPDKMSYLGSDGKYYSQPPANVELGEGHETRYTNQNLQINVTETTSGEPIKGKLVKYTITTGISKDYQVTFDYVPKGDNIQNIAFDDEFIKLLDSKTKQVSVTNKTFYTDIRIKPVFEYRDVEIEVLEETNGTFTDSSLTPGKHTGKYHIGDTLHLDGVPANANVYYVGYNEKAYKNSSDTSAFISGDMDGTNDLLLDCERYVLKPRFSNLENHIRINLTDNAKDKLSILNTVPDNVLPENISGNTGLVLNTGESSYDYKPKGGKVYSVQAIAKKQAPNGKIYRPKFTISTSSETINGNVFDFVAGDYPADNVITVDVEEVDVSKMNYFEVDGFVTIPGNAIRSSAFDVTEAGAQGVTVIAGGKQSKLYDQKTSSVIDVIDRPSSTTADNGAFSLKGLYAADGDRITVCVTNGDVERVEYVTVTGKGLEKQSMEFTERVYNEETKQVVDTPVTKDGYIMNCVTINMPVRTPLAPYVSSIKYEVDQIPDLTIDTRNNSIPIVSTKLYVHADVNLNNREVKSAIFTRVSKNGSREEKQVDATQKGQIRFTAEYQMDTTFEDGDMLYVSLVDAEDRVITTVGTDENGNQYTSKTTEPRRYFDVFTGLTFYIPELEVKPQTYDIENMTSVEIPILGDMAPKMSTGTLSFTTEKLYKDDPNSPYYLQFLFTPGVSNTDKITALSRLNGIKQSSNKIYNELSSTPENEERLMHENIQNMFGEESHDVEKEIKNEAYKKSLANAAKGVKFDVRLVVLLSFYFSYIPGENGSSGEYKMTSGQYCIGAYAGIMKLFYWSVYGVPMYVKLNANFEIDFSGNYITDDAEHISDTDFKYTKNLNDLLNPSNYLMLGLGGQIAVGVGVCGVLGARGIVSVDFVFRFKYGKKTDDRMDGFLFKLGGGFGIDLLLFSFDYVPSILTYGSGVYKGVGGGVIDLSSDEDIIEAANDSDGFVLRELNSGNSDLSTFGSQITVADGNTSNYAVLLNNAAERTRPQLVTFDNGKKVLFFIDKDASRDAANSSCLYYSVCSADGVWQIPQIVDNDGTADSMPAVVRMGSKCLISWSDANKTFDDNTAPAEALSSFEISYDIFDSETETLSGETVLTSDSFLDNNIRFSCKDNDVKFCYYLKRDILQANSETSLVDVNATYSTIAYKEYDEQSNTWGEEKYLNIPCEEINDPLIIDFDSEITEYDGNTYTLLTYTIDFDNDISTVDDRDLYLMITDNTNQISYYPIKITNNYISEISPKLTKFDGDIYLSWVFGGEDFCMLNISEAVREINKDEDPNVESKMNLYLSRDSSSPDWYKMTASELGLTDDEYSGSIFEKLATNNFNVNSTNFSTDEYIDRNIGSYELYNNCDEAMYLIWVDADKAEKDETSQEVFGAVFEKAEDTGKYSSWSNAVQLTDFGKTIDEFTVAFDQGQNMYLSANMFEQSVDDNGALVTSENNLILFENKRASNLELSDDGIEFETIPRSYETTNIKFNLENNGLLTVGGYDLKVSQVQGGAETEIYSMSSESPIISGHSSEVIIPWTVPGSLDDLQIKVEVTEPNVSTEPYIITKDIEKKSDIQINDSEIEFDYLGNPYLNVAYENAGNDIAENVIVSCRAKPDENGNPGKEYGNCDVYELLPGEYGSVTMPLTGLEYSDVDKYGNCELFINISSKTQTVSGTKMLYCNKCMAITADCEDSIAMASGDSIQINAQVQPSSAVDKEIVYYTSNPGVANISPDGKLTANANGTATIVAYNPSTVISKRIDVTVTGGAEPEPSPTKKPSQSGGGSYSGNSGLNTGSSASSGDATPSPAATFAPAETPVPGIESGLPFTDVTPDDWFYDGIKYAYDNGLFEGTTDTLFEPDTSMTRGMLVTVLGRAEGIDKTTPADTAFTDVNPDEYYAPYIAWASENGIVDGNGDGTFSPDENVTREQMAKIFLGYYTYRAEGPVGAWAIRLPYSDVDQISDWAVSGVMFCTINNLFEGKENNMFDPQGEATRAETATVMMRADIK